ncbi:pyridoxamine 5'-phosphate oxidase family protein [Weeksellaceae bacterium KMM 9724]|uniref:pyridoxamine 5'-phosphate oxidase family protein n=1 Tax=Profundicola chukchiensis TaxID=2961959 RepID=UPI00243D5C73|nr:pyridoxamine 5'-phosphate oxidase family protein [Profundicola chukchiensis]MDG4951207.1 pyridoxamine 5'-phosphate oxidase family protein [Profundicola chukchiensis]
MSEKNYFNKEAIDKLKELAESARICMMTTKLDERPSPSRPMTLQEVDENGILWFLSGRDSDKNYELKKDTKTQLYFMNNSKSEYLSVYGTAEIYLDQNTIDEHWSVAANAWFKEGKEDPNVSVIGIKPLDMKYWGTKHGKFVDIALMAYSALTGADKGSDGGEEGKLEV